MRFAPMLGWTLGDPPQPLDGHLLPLLRAIRDSGSLAAAVRTVGLSYRSAWGLLREHQQRLSAPLVTLSRGRRATLAPAGVRMLQVADVAAERFAALVPSLTADIGAVATPAGAPRSRGARLRVAVVASHDLLLAAMRDRLGQAGQLEVDLSFMGSLHALEAFRAGGAVLAGFHVPLPMPRTKRAFDPTPFRRLLRSDRHRIVSLVLREQGLMLAEARAGRTRSFGDVAARGLRFVNRQRGSGTRLVIDALLARERIRPERIAGYDTEEFTHRAVAATIAAGRADVGFGLRAAAAEHALAFVPLVRERYCFAVARAALRDAAIAALLAYWRSPGFAALVQSLPGYRLDAPGDVHAVEWL